MIQHFKPLLLLFVVLIFFAPSWPALALDCQVSYRYDEKKQRYECTQGNDGGYCDSWGDMFLMLPCDKYEEYYAAELLMQRYRSKATMKKPEPAFRFLPVFFPPSNARLDERFSSFVEFVIDAYQRAELQWHRGLSGKGGIVVDNKSYNVLFDVSVLTGEERKTQKWHIQIAGYGTVDMEMKLIGEEVQVKYIRTMDGGSHTESKFSYRADARCPRPVILDPSSKPIE